MNAEKNIKTIKVTLTDYSESIKTALDQLKAGSVLSSVPRILIKPNLVNASPYPVTTPAACCEAIIDYIRLFSDAETVIAEGCGVPSMETSDVFRSLGYDRLSEKYGVKLIDLNHEPVKRYENPACPVFPEMHLPEIAFTHYIISVPVLKAHSLAEITGTLKNMMGFAPPEYYSGGGFWRKAAFHQRMHQSIRDLNAYRTPDLTVMDAGIGLADYHLGGAACDPPVRKILAGYDPADVDRTAASLLNRDWRKIEHLKFQRNNDQFSSITSGYSIPLTV